MPEPIHPTIAAAERFRASLLAMERRHAVRLVQEYGRIYQSLGALIAALDADIAALGDGVSAAKVARLERYRILQRQIVEEVGRYAIVAEAEINAATLEAIQAAIAESQALALAGLPPQAAQVVAGVWNRLPVDAINAMLGFLGTDSPLRTRLVQDLGPAVADAVGRALLEGLALGYNPRKVATIIRNSLGQGLTWSLRTARTSMIWSYREATRASYIANPDIIKGWIWHAKLGDGRTCLSCIEQHGTEFPPDAVLNDHHNGRCAMVPVTVSWEELGIRGVPETRRGVTPGPEWFNSLTPAEQRKYFKTQAMWNAWQAGQVNFGDFSVPHTDDVYGEMLREASLKGILGDRARQFYRQAA